MANKKKKVVSAIAAVATSAALLLGGTLAWQSANQVALNEASDVINPGGRLHDDFDGENKDVYVENFTDPNNGGEDIFARIRLEEYFEIVTNYKTAAEKVHTLVGTATATETDAASTDNTGESIVNIGTKFSGEKYERGYTTHIFTEENVASGDAAVDADGNAWWKWTLGGQTDYMPTYNLNKDSLMADVNGKFDGAVGTITDRDATDPDAQYTADRQADFPYVEYTAGDTAEGFEVFDGDPNNLDEVESQLNLKDMIDNGTELYPDNIVLSEDKEVHTAATTLEGSLMSMAQWIADGSQPGPYWVYDTDGWVYWAQAIEPGTATGLLLDGIELNQVMDDTWYYAINVIAQFVTADDVGKSDGTGFYDTEKGSAPTADAEEFLKEIGVTSVSDAPAEDDDEPQTYDLTLNYAGTNRVSGTTKDSYNIGFDESSIPDDEGPADTTGIVVYQEDASGFSLRSTPVALDESQYSYAEGVLSLTDDTLTSALRVTDLSGVLYGFIDLSAGGAGGEEEKPFTVELGYNYASSASSTVTPTNYKTTTATLYEYGEPYGGTGVVTWRLEEELGDIDDTTIAEDGTISIGVELENGVNDYEIFKVIASIDGEDVASRNMLMFAYRSDNLPVHGFRFYQEDGTEVPADQLVTGVTYDVESYLHLLVDDTDTLVNGDPLTDYLDYYPVDQMQGIKVSIADPRGDASPDVAAFSDGQFTAYVADTYLIRSEGGNYDLEYLLYQEVTVSGESGGEEEVVDTFTIEGTEMTDTNYFDYYLAEDAFIYTVNQEHTLHVDGLTNHLGGSPDTGKYSIMYNSNYNMQEVFINKLTADGPMFSEESYLPTSVEWNDETAQYDITFTIPQEWVNAGIDSMMMRLASYHADDDSWSAGPAGPYLVIMLEEAAGSSDPGDTVGPTFTVGDKTATAVIDYDLSTGDRVESGVYAGHEIQVTSSDLTGSWTVTGIDVTPSTGVTDDGLHSHVTFTIPADTAQGTEITVTQTVNGAEYYITLVVSRLMPAPIINYAGDPSNIDDEGFITLAPGESAQFIFEDANGVLTNNADVDWAVTAMDAEGTIYGAHPGMKIIENSSSDRTATVYHTCEPGACSCGADDAIYFGMVTLTASDGSSTAECYTAYIKPAAGDAEYTAPTFSGADERTGMTLFTNMASGWSSGYVYRGANVLFSSTDMTNNWNVTDGITGTASQDTPAHKGYFRFTVPADFEGDTITVTQIGGDGNDYSITLNVEDATLAVNLTGNLSVTPESYLVGSTAGYRLAVSYNGATSGKEYIPTGRRLSYLTYSAVNENGEAVNVDSNAYIYVTGQTTAITATVSWNALGLTASDTISPMSAEEAEESPLYTLLDVTNGYENPSVLFELSPAGDGGTGMIVGASVKKLLLSTNSSNEWSVNDAARPYVTLNTDHGYSLEGTPYKSAVLLEINPPANDIAFKLYQTSGETRFTVPHINTLEHKPVHTVYDNETGEQLTAAPLTDGNEGYRVFPGAQIKLHSNNGADYFTNSAGYEANVDRPAFENINYTFTVSADAQVGFTFSIVQTTYQGYPLCTTYFEVIAPSVPLFTLTHMAGGNSHAYVAPHAADSEPIAVYPGDIFKVESTLEGEMSCDISHLANNNGFGKIGNKLGYEDTDNYYLSLSSDTANLGQTLTITQTVNGETYHLDFVIAEEPIVMPEVDYAALYSEGYGSPAAAYTGSAEGVDYQITGTSGVYAIAIPQGKTISTIVVCPGTLGEDGSTVTYESGEAANISVHDFQLTMTLTDAAPGYYQVKVSYPDSGSSYDHFEFYVSEE